MFTHSIETDGLANKRVFTLGLLYSASRLADSFVCASRCILYTTSVYADMFVCTWTWGRCFHRPRRGPLSSRSKPPALGQLHCWCVEGASYLSPNPSLLPVRRLRLHGLHLRFYLKADLLDSWSG